MVQLIYFASLLVSMGYLAVLLIKFQKHISVYYILLASAVIFQCLGFLQMAGSKSAEAALMGVQLTNLAYPFLLLFMINVIAELCKVHVPKAVQIISVCTGLTIFFGSITVGYVGWFYKSLHLVEKDDFAFLAKDYGPLHTLVPIYIIAMLCYGFGIVISALRHKKSVSHFVSIGSLAMLTIASAVYLGERLIGLQVELMPVAYVITLGGVILMVNRVVTYDVEGISREAIEESQEYGFVVCDGKGRFSGADAKAKEWFPELNRLEIDYKIKLYNTDFLKQLKKWIIEQDKEETVYFNCGELILEVQHTIPHEHKGKLHCIQMRDDTRQQKYLKLVENYNEQLTDEVNDKTARLVEIQNDIIVSMASIVENRDSSTGGHIRRTSDLVKVFVNSLMKDKYSTILSEETARNIIEAAPLHDFGKIAIPDMILNNGQVYTGRI